MKTLKEIDNEIKEVEAGIKKELDLGLIKSRTLKILKTKMIELRFLKKYLEFNPTKESVIRQLDGVKKTLSNINEAYPNWHPPKPNIKNRRAAYESEMGVKKLKTQIKTLKYLVS